MFQRVRTWWQRLFGGTPATPEARVDAWLRDLNDRVVLLDNGIARLRAELLGHEHVLSTLQARLTASEQDIADCLARGERQRAATLALEREQLLARRPRREADLATARTDLERALLIQRRFLVRQTAEIQRLRSLQRETTTAGLMAAIAEIDATMLTVPGRTFSEAVLAEVTTAADLERARLRVAADLGGDEAGRVHSTAVVDEPPALTHSS